MKIEVTKLTDEDLMRETCDATRHPGQVPSKMTLEKAYQCQHSPVRSQLFKIRLEGIPSYVSTHIVRHSATGQVHYVESNRSDRGGSDKVDRMTPVTHLLIVNAQHLMDMSLFRLCYVADKRTVAVFARLKKAIAKVDPDLAKAMVPKCVKYGYCNELKPCVAGPVSVILAYRDSFHFQKRQEVNEEINKRLNQSDYEVMP